MPSSLLRPVPLLVALALAACGGDSGSEMSATPDDVDPKSGATPTEREVASFRAPADSVLTPQQVEAYLKTTLLQFDLVRAEAPRLHEEVARIEERGQRGGVIAGLRNVAAGASLLATSADLIGGSFVRSARSLGYNPAEMEWVRERMIEVSGHLVMRPMLEMGVEQAASLRTQAEAYRGQPGFDQASIDAILQSADEMEENARREMASSRAVAANAAALRRARSEVTDPMWAAIAFVGGTGGLWAWGGLSDPQSTEAQRQLDEWRRVYTDALENRVTPGMEASVPFGEARPRLEESDPDS
jgi:hypothetical protein